MKKTNAGITRTVGSLIQKLIPIPIAAETNFCFEDRKSTRLNSSHLVISYAVFCLKKKTQVVHQCQAGAARQPRTHVQSTHTRALDMRVRRLNHSLSLSVVDQHSRRHVTVLRAPAT